MKSSISIALLLSAALSTSACQMDSGMDFMTRAPQTPLTAEEQQLRQQKNAFNKTVFEGAAAGAMLGAVLGGLAGGDASDMLAGAAIGGALGGASGYYIAGRQSQYASAEQQLNEAIAFTRQQNSQLDQVLATQRRVIENDRQRLTSLQRKVARGEASNAELSAALNTARSNRAMMADISGDLAGESQKLSQNVALAKQTNSSSANQMQREVNKFNTKQNSYNRSLAQYDALIESIDLGDV